MPIDVITTAAEVTTTSDITAEDSDFKGGETNRYYRSS